MGYTFNGDSKIIVLTVGTTGVEVIDLYSRWKDWASTGDNSKYLEAMRVVGGDPISSIKNLGSTFFMINGWRIRPQESNHWLKVEGNLFTDPSGFAPFIATQGSYNVTIEMTVSNLSDVITVSTGSGLSQAEHDTLLILNSYIKNRKFLNKEGLVWYIIVRNDNDDADIIKKALKDKNGNNITDIQAGLMTQELESSV